MPTPVSELPAGQTAAGSDSHKKSHESDTDAVSFRSWRIVALDTAPKKKSGSGRLYLEFAEHGFLGDDITLKLDKGAKEHGWQHAFTLQNGLQVTYGQICGLAGDFYGTTEPISDGENFEEQRRRFVAAFDTLAVNETRQPAEAQAILDILKDEVQKVETAAAHGIDPSSVYAALKSQTRNFEKLTLLRPCDQPSYLGISAINWDHFGDDARTAYNAGHAAALEMAKARKGDAAGLDAAYTMNAFADHFLQDSFSAGHTRTPRRQLHSMWKVEDLCAKYMHDEDNAIGLQVTNPANDKWTLYGDKRLLDTEPGAVKTKQLSLKAVQKSADEIYGAWSTGDVPAQSSYGAWQFAPTLESARAETQTLPPLFTFENEPKRRSDITNRRSWKFISDWGVLTTLALIKRSGLWKYPMQLTPLVADDGHD